MKTAVLLVAFNKPDITKIVLDRILEAKPEKLYISFDAPRQNVAEDVENCAKTRALIEDLRGDCKIIPFFRQENEGAKKAFTGAIDWFFENEDEGIVIEDDGLADLSFFPFAEELLERYRNDTRVMHITAFNPIDYAAADGASYYFAKMQHCFAFATWKRAWSLHDMNMPDFQDFVKTNAIEKAVEGSCIQKPLLELIDTYGHNNHNWDVCWAYTVLKNNGFCINPSVNLVKNIDIPSTHIAYKEAGEMSFPLIHPKFMLFDTFAVQKIFEDIFDFKCEPNIPNITKESRLQKLLNNLFKVS